MIVNGYFEKRMAWYPLDRLTLELSATQVGDGGGRGQRGGGRAESTSILPCVRARVSAGWLAGCILALQAFHRLLTMGTAAQRRSRGVLWKDSV